MWQNLKLALRILSRKPGYSLAVCAMLAVGIAGNTAIFSIYNGLFLRPLPFRGGDRLVDLDETAPKWNLRFVSIANPDFHAWREQNSTFEQMAFYIGRDCSLSGHGPAQRVQSLRVTRGMLDVFQLQPALGRNFLPEEDRPNGAKVVLLGYDLWRRQFNGDPNVLGRVLKLDAEPFTVVGVLPAEAVFPIAADVWFPLAAGTEAGSFYLSGIGRLKPGVTMEQARADLTRIHRGLIATGRTVNDITSPVVNGVRERVLGDLRPGAVVLLGAVAVVLLIACANIAGLMMVRAFARSREFAIRAALGASRGNIVRQMLTESLVLAMAGGAAGLLLGRLGLHAMLASLPDERLPRWVSFAFDGRSAAFGIAITAGAAILFGLAPALNAVKGNLQGRLRDTARTSLSRRRRSYLSVLVVGEIGLALLLLTAAGLLFQALRSVLKVDPGFRAENVLTFRVSMPQAKYPKDEHRVAYVERLVERLRVLPGVKYAGAASSVPLGGHWGEFFVAEGQPPLGPNDQNPVVLHVAALPGYLDAIGVRFMAGRQFTERDGNPGTLAAIINETFARRFFPNSNPVGKHIRYAGDKDKKWIEVVGVTRDVKHYGLDREMAPSVYVPFRQYVIPFTNVVLRTTVDPSALVAPAREVLRQLDPDLPMLQPTMMTEQLDRSLWQRRFLSWLAAAFAGVALLLAAGGIFGVISYAVSQRTQEIGIRIALGASSARVMRQVLCHGLLLLAMGVPIGIAAAVGLAGVLQRALFGVSARDPLTYSVAVIAVAAVVLASNIVPARRAASVDPIKALRAD